MNGSEWLSTLPENPGLNRDVQVLQAISEGIAICTWTPVISTYQNHQATFQVCEDAVYVILDDNSRFRFQVNAHLAQLCADALNASLITSKISDLAYQQAKIKLAATTLPAGPDMVTTSKSKKWNVEVEKKRNGQEGLLRDCGKAWILSNQLGQYPNVAINYGFYDPKAPYANKFGTRMWQTIGSRHDSAHTDYSQTLILMSKVCQVDGQDMKIQEVMQSHELAGLISDEGVLRFLRQPGVSGSE